MTTRVGSFPHPVLGNGDDVNSSLSVSSPEASHSPVDTQIKLRLESDDPDLFEYIKDGTIVFSIWWECVNTLSSGRIIVEKYTTLHHSIEFEITLLQEDLRGKVTLSPEFTAGRDLTGFKWTNQHEDYGDIGFNIRKGDFLASADKLSFNAQKTYDALNPPLGSLFRFIEKKEQTAPITMDYSDSEEITVFLSSDLANLVRDLGDLDSIKIATVVLPALMDALAFIAKNQGEEKIGDFEDYEWFKSLQTLIHNQKIDLDHPLEAAEKMLKETTVTALQKITDTNEEDF